MFRNDNVAFMDCGHSPAHRQVAFVIVECASVVFIWECVTEL